MKDLEDGIYKDLDPIVYHALPRLSKSGMMDLNQSPAHFKYRLDHPEPPTPIMILGSATHAFILEPETFQKRFAISAPGQEFRSKADKEWKAEQEAAGKEVIKHEKMADLEGMKKAVWAHPIAAGLLKDFAFEYSLLWTDPATGIKCKARPDIISFVEDPPVFVDLKTTTDARPQAFTRIAYNMGYHIQAGWYPYGGTHLYKKQIEKFVFIVVETAAPYGVMVYFCSQEFLMEGQTEMMRLSNIYAECLEKDSWPCYPEDITVLDLPGWKKRKDYSPLI